MDIREEVVMEKVVSEDIGDSEDIRIKKIQNAFQSSENIKEPCQDLFNQQFIESLGFHTYVVAECTGVDR